MDENQVIEIPESDVTIEHFGGDDDSSSAKDTAIGIGVIGGAFAGGILFSWAFRKIKKKIDDAKMAMYLKRKEEEARLEEELARRRAEENNTDDETDDSLDD